MNSLPSVSLSKRSLSASWERIEDCNGGLDDGARDLSGSGPTQDTVDRSDPRAGVACDIRTRPANSDRRCQYTNGPSLSSLPDSRQHAVDWALHGRSAGRRNDDSYFG